MMPRPSGPTSCDHATQSLASRLEVVRSYVQDSESGDENSDESSIGSMGGSDEHLPKERAYSVGCKPPMVCHQLRLHAGYGGSSRPPRGPGGGRATAGESKQRHQDSPGGARTRKISVTSRPEHFQKLSAESGSGSSKSLTLVESKSAAEPDKSVDRGSAAAVEGRIRPRTLTMPWDLLRGVARTAADDPLRPRSSSGGNAASIREAVQARLGRHPASVTAGAAAASRPGTGCTDLAAVRQLTPQQHRELVMCPGDGQEVGEYVEMRCPAAS